jgi:hypothetical protein
MRLERRLQCFQSCHRDTDLLNHVHQLERNLQRAKEEKVEALKQLSDQK